MLPSRVKALIGVTEQELVVSKDKSQYITEKDGLLYFTNGTPIGEFSTPSIKDLKGMLSSTPVRARSKRCKLAVLQNTDTGVLQANLKTADKAMVQVASNFNCLEVPSRYRTPDCGDLVEYADQDTTQGPAACFGPLAGYLYRTHFVFGGDGQTSNKQINLLENVTDYFGVPVNGKLTLKGDESLVTHPDSVVNAVKIGLHTDVSVIYGRNKQGLNYELDEPYPQIDQCFSSTINYNDYGQHTKNIDIISRTLLRAAYEGVYLSALTRQSKNLYLTMIGGGSFGNKESIILEEMTKAHLRWANHPTSALENVYLCLYEPDSRIIEKLKMINTQK